MFKLKNDGILIILDKNNALQIIIEKREKKFTPLKQYGIFHLQILRIGFHRSV